MREMRERSAAVGGSLAAEPERLSARKVGCALAGEGGASSGKLKVFETRKGKNKRRLIMSDSETEDYPVFPHRQRTPSGSESVDVEGNCSDARKMQFEGSVKNGKQVPVAVNRIGQRDVVKYRHNGSINLRSSVSPVMERKRSREALQNGFDDDGIPLKKIKMVSLKCGKDKREKTDAEGMRLDSVRCGVGKSLIRVSRLPGAKQVMAADEGSESFGKTGMEAHLKGNRSYETEKSSCLERSNQKMYRSPKHNISSSSTQHCSVSSDGKTLRLQGRGGVLRLLPNNKKFVGHSASRIEGRPDESRKSPGSSHTAYKNTFSKGRELLKKSGSSLITDGSGKSPQFSGDADQRPSNLFLSEGRKPLRSMGYSSMREEARRSPGHSNFADQTVQKRLLLQKDRKCHKERDSPIKVEKRKDPQRSGRVQVMLKHHTSSEDRMSLKRSGSSSSEDIRNCPGRSSCTATLSEERKSLKSPGCPSMQRKSHVQQKAKGLKLKKESDNPSPHRGSKNADEPYKRTAVKDRGAGKFITKDLVSSENATTSEKASRKTEKQKLRDHIKNMLLNAGWKIDMRPRRGRNYEDAVYVSPQGTGYWSITKAYAALQEQCDKNVATGNEEDEDLHGQLYKESSTTAHNHNGIASQFSAIPLEVLKILKRNVVQKRRRRIEEDKRDNGKHATSSKYAKIRKVVVIKKRTSENGIVGLSRKKNKNGRGCTLLARTSEANSDDDDYIPYAGKRSILAWMIDSGTVPANGKVKYMNKRHTRTMLEGLITRDGIHCSCCSKLLTVSKFEIHAGSKLNRPYANIFVEESGASLLQCQLDAWDRQKESERCAFHLIGVTDDDPNDDTCAICGDGGDLICCDSCPSTFHLSCLGIQMLPPGDWNCMNCLCRFCGVSSSSAIEGNSVTCSLVLLSCGQCEAKYHQACVPDADATPVSNSPSLSFCGQNCRMLFEHLQNLLGVKNDLDAGFSWTLVRRFDNETLSSCSKLAQRAECNSKIAVALAVMNECFLPIIDRRSGINLIHNVLYNRGSNFSRLSYSGFYTFILERGDEIISAASIRILGTKLAEMPFIGTRDMYRRQGMCRRLLNVIEMTLSDLKVEKLVIPAISELMHTWTLVFGFKPLDDSDKQEIKSMNMLVFPDTGLLQKTLQGRESNTANEEGLGPIDSDTAMISNRSDARIPNDATVGCSLGNRDEIGIKKPCSPSSNSSVHETPGLSCQPSEVPSDAPLRSDTEALRYKSLESAPYGASSVDHNVAYHDKSCSENNLSSGSCIEPRNQDNHATRPRVPIVNKLSIQDSLDVIGKPFNNSTFVQIDCKSTLHAMSEDAGKLSENMSEKTDISSEIADKSDDVTLSNGGKDAAKVTTIKSDTCALHDDRHLCVSEAFASKIEAIFQVNTCKSIACEISEAPSPRECPQSEGDLQISDHCLRQGSELPQGSPEFACGTAIPIASHSVSGSLQNAHDMSNETRLRDQTVEVNDDSVCAASKCDLPVPHRDNSQNMSDNSSDATHAQSFDACKHNFYERQKDLQAVILPSEFCPTYVNTLVNKNGVENGAAAVLSNHHASVEEYKCCTAEVMKSNGSVPGDRYSF